MEPIHTVAFSSALHHKAVTCSSLRERYKGCRFVRSCCCCCLSEYHASRNPHTLLGRALIVWYYKTSHVIIRLHETDDGYTAHILLPTQEVFCCCGVYS